MAPDVVADIERGVRLPTIGILHRLAAALRVGAGELLPSPLERPRVEVHLPVADGARSQTARVIGAPGDPTQTWLLELLPEEDGGGHDAHAGDELLVVEEGEVLCAFEGRKDRRVVAGRSLAIDPGVPHRLRAGESGPARFLVVRTDAVEG